MKTPEEIKVELEQFIGTTRYFKHVFVLYTEGVKYLADSCECYWLLDLIISWLRNKKDKKQEFQVYKLKVNDDKSAILSIEDGNNKILATEEIIYTDFPLPEIVLWFANNVLYLPSEH